MTSSGRFPVPKWGPRCCRSSGRVDVTGIELKNIFDFVFKINGVRENFEDDVILKTGDKIELKISKKNDYLESIFIVTGESPENVDVTERKDIHVN